MPGQAKIYFYYFFICNQLLIKIAIIISQIDLIVFAHYTLKTLLDMTLN